MQPTMQATLQPTKRAIAAGMGIAVVMAAAGGLAQTQDTPPQATAPAQSEAPAPTAPPLQNATPAPGDAVIEGAARYSFARVDGDLLRLDGITGQVTVCSQRAAGWACRAVPQERAALEKEIGRLQDEVATLKTEIAALREPEQPPRPPADLAPVPDKNKTDAKSILPSPDQIENARAAIEKAWQRLVDMIVGLKNDMMRKG